MSVYTSQVLVSSTDFKQVYRVTRPKHLLCLKRRVFATAQERNAAYLRTGLQKLLIHENICKVHKRRIYEEDLHVLEVESDWAGLCLEEIHRKNKKKGENWSQESMYVLLTSLLSVLSFSHSQSIPHSNLSLTNIFQDENEIFRVTDFSYSLSPEILPEPHVSFFSPQRKAVYLAGIMRGGEEGKWDPYKDDVYAVGRVMMELVRGEASIPTDSGLHPLISSMLSPEEAQRPSAQSLLPLVQLAKDQHLLSAANEYISFNDDTHFQYALWYLWNISTPIQVHITLQPRTTEEVIEENVCLKCGVTCDFGYILHCRRHVVCLDHAEKPHSEPCLYPICWVCEQPRLVCVVPELLYTNGVDVNVNFGVMGNGGYFTVGREVAAELGRGKCHWCNRELQGEWKYVPHGGRPAFVCSAGCSQFNVTISQGVDPICPLCSSPIPRVSIHSQATLSSSFLSLPEGHCTLCRLRPTQIFFYCECGICEKCFKDNYQSISKTYFACVRCGLRLQVEEYRTLLRRLELI